MTGGHDGRDDVAARLDNIAHKLAGTPASQNWVAGNDWTIAADCGRCGQQIVAHWFNGAHLQRVVCSMFDLALEAHKLDCPELAAAELPFVGSKPHRVSLPYALAG